jgi:hypothetical protein
MGTGSLSGGMALTTNLHIAPRLKKEERYTFTPPLTIHGVFYGQLYLLPDTSYVNLIEG